MDTQKSGQTPYNGHTARPLPLYYPYISTSKEGTTSEKCLSPMCPFFGGSTVYSTVKMLVCGLDSKCSGHQWLQVYILVCSREIFMPLILELMTGGEIKIFSGWGDV